MTRPRRTHTAEFKAEAVKLVTEQGYSVAEAARSLGLGDSLLRSWVAALREKGPDAFPGNGRLNPHEEELRRLRAENKRLTMEREILKSGGVLRQGGDVIFAFIEGNRSTWPVRVLCGALGVSASGFYAWLRRPPSFQEQRREALLELIRDIHAKAKGRYGSPRIHAALAGADGARSVNTIAKIMRHNELRAKTAKKFRCQTTDSDHANPVADNLLDRDFEPSGPNRAWVADITYIPTGEGWLYLAAVEDLFSRMVVGWSMDATMTSRLVVDALEMAIRRRLPSEGLVAHSDRGSQYASDHYRRLLADHGIDCSMSAKGQCWDNAPAESFFATLKKELVHDEEYGTRAEAKASIFEYVEVFYNNERLHSKLGYVSPAAYERSR